VIIEIKACLHFLTSISIFLCVSIFSFFILNPIIPSNLLAQEKHKVLFKKLLLGEIEKHPHSIVEDIYKFIHQASFGSEHAVKDTQAVRKWMENEIANLNYSITDELIDHLSPDGKLVRINLRPFLKKGYDPNLLLDAFIKTANNYIGSTKNFKSFWKAAKELAKTKKYSFTEDETNNFFDVKSKKGFPAIHHSTEYEAEYKPAYRVVDLQYLPFLNK
jgi:hypothetical protein